VEAVPAVAPPDALWRTRTYHGDRTGGNGTNSVSCDYVDDLRAGTGSAEGLIKKTFGHRGQGPSAPGWRVGLGAAQFGAGRRNPWETRISPAGVAEDKRVGEQRRVEWPDAYIPTKTHCRLGRRVRGKVVHRHNNAPTSKRRQPRAKNASRGDKHWATRGRHGPKQGEKED